MTRRIQTQSDPSDPIDRDRDLELMHRVRRGEEAAFEELIRLYWTALVRYASRILDSVDAAEDVAQQAFLQLWRSRATWQFTGSVHSYLYRIARNEALNERRRLRRRAGFLLRRRSTPTPAPPDQVAEGNQLQEAIECAIAALPERRREVWTLVRFHGLSYREVGSVMGISVATVGNQLSLAVRDIRQSLGALLDDPAPSKSLLDLPTPSTVVRHNA